VWPVALLSALVVAAVLAVLPADDDRRGAAEAPRDPVAAFLEAYERSRTATFVVEQRFTRTVPGRGELAYERRLVQRPPDDRLLVGGGSAEGRLDGRVVRCSTEPSGTSGCVEGPPAGSYQEEVAAEVAELEHLVGGANPPYRVEAGEPGCFALRLRLAILTPPYGDLAGFCFDGATGAPTRFEVHRSEAVDLVEALAIRAEVGAADLRIGDLGSAEPDLED
jgi:hypothetical protein